MPTYDYQCAACGHAFELFQSMKDPVKRTCPACGKRSLERLIGTGAAILFKGSGFYQTDYRSESYKKAQQADKPSGAGESKPDTKPDSKPDAKPKADPDAKARPPSAATPAGGPSGKAAAGA